MAFDFHRLIDNLVDALVRQFVVNVLVEEAGKVSVHAFIARDQFVREAESWHDSSLLEPEDSTEAAREEDALDGCESNHALGEALRGLDPLEGPLSLHLHGRDVVDGLEQKILFLLVFDVSVDQN